MLPLDDDDHVDDSTSLDDDTFMSGTFVPMSPWYKPSKMLLGKAFLVPDAQMKICQYSGHRFPFEFKTRAFPALSDR